MITAARELPQGPGPLTARRWVVFTQASGLRLRLADLLVRRATAFRADIWLEGPGGRANGKSLLDLMALAAACGATLEIEARGPDAEGAVAALAALIGAGSEASEEGGHQPRAASCPATGRILRTETGLIQGATVAPAPASVCHRGGGTWLPAPAERLLDIAPNPLP
jgi:phosphocarrier protein HPr